MRNQATHPVLPPRGEPFDLMVMEMSYPQDDTSVVISLLFPDGKIETETFPHFLASEQWRDEKVYQQGWVCFAHWENPSPTDNYPTVVVWIRPSKSGSIPRTVELCHDAKGPRTHDSVEVVAKRL